VRKKNLTNLRLDSHVFSIGEVNIGSVNSNVMILYDNSIGLHLGNQVIILCCDNLGDSSKVVSDLFGLDLAVGGPECRTRG
jgi:hypothetical protein